MNLLEKITNKITEWIGTPISILIHTFIFIGIFSLRLFGVELESILLILTTAVSLEAIYLAIFIQMSVNKSNATIQDIEKDVDEIQADVDEIQEDVGELQEDIEDIQEDVEEIQEDVEDIGEVVIEDDEDEINGQTEILKSAQIIKLQDEISEVKNLLKKLNEILNRNK
jgi:predicted  nucleic acid-binding Zn-ribbon protein